MLEDRNKLMYVACRRPRTSEPGRGHGLSGTLYLCGIPSGGVAHVSSLSITDASFFMSEASARKAAAIANQVGNIKSRKFKVVPVSAKRLLT